MDHHRKNMVLTKAVWLLFGLSTAYGSVLRTYPYPQADYFSPPSETYGLPHDCIKNVTAIIIPPAPELPPHVSAIVVENQLVNEGSERGNYEEYHGEQFKNEAALTVIPPAPELPPFTSQVVVESKNQFDASLSAPAPVLPPVVLTEVQTPLVAEKYCDCATEEVPQSPVQPFVVVVEDQSAIQDSVQSVIIPRAPVLPELVLSEIPKPAVIEERYPFPVADVEEEPIYIPQAPELPPSANPVPIPVEHVSAPCAHDSYIEVNNAIVVPQPPELPPIVLPEFHTTEIVEDWVKGVYPVVIPQAPELPPLVLPEIPPSVIEEKPAETYPYPPALPKQPCDIEIVVAEPIAIPQAPELPPYYNTDTRPAVYVEEQIKELKPVFIPQAPELPPLVYPELPPRVFEEKVIETRPYPPALPEQPCDVEVVVAEPIVEVKPVFIPQAPELPPLVLPEFPPRVFEEKVIETRPYPPALPEQPCDVEVVVAEPVVEVKPVFIPQAPELPPLVLPEFPPRVFEEKVIETRPYPPALPEQPCDVEVVVAEPVVEVKPVFIPQAPELPPLVLPEFPPRVFEEKVIETRPYPPALPEQPCDVEVVVAEPVVEVKPVFIPQAPELPPLVLPEFPPRVFEEKVIETRPYPPALPEQPCDVVVEVAEPIVEVKPVFIPQAPELPPLVLPEFPPRVFEEKVIETRPYPPALPEQPCDVEVVVAEPVVEVKPVFIPQAPELPPLVLPEFPPRVFEEKVIETRPYPPALPEQPCDVVVEVAEPIVEVKPVFIPQAPELPPLVLPEFPPRVFEEKVIETRPYPPALPEQPCDVEVVVAEPNVEVKPIVIPPAPELPTLELPELPPRIVEEEVIETHPCPPALPVEVVVTEPIVIPQAPVLPPIIEPITPVVVVKPIVVPSPPELPTRTINEEEYSNVNVIVPVVPKLPECVKTDIPIIVQERIVDRIVTYPFSKYGIHFKPLQSSYKPLSAVNLIPGAPAKEYGIPV